MRSFFKPEHYSQIAGFSLSLSYYRVRVFVCTVLVTFWKFEKRGYFRNPGHLYLLKVFPAVRVLCKGGHDVVFLRKVYTRNKKKKLFSNCMLSSINKHWICLQLTHAGLSDVGSPNFEPIVLV